MNKNRNRVNDHDKKGRTDGLYKSRIHFCFAFVAKCNGYCDGYRHFLMFIFIAAAFPLYGTAEAMLTARRLSGNFVDSRGLPHPIGEAEIVSMVNRMQRKNYRISNKRICEWLHMTDAEYADLALGHSKSKRRSERKAETQKKRERRNEMIMEAVDQGKTYKEIAETEGCSVRTVASVVSAYRCRE